MPIPFRALSLLPLLAAPLAAQAVEGIVQAGGAPAGHALVALMDSTGREAAVTLSDAAGRFSLQAPAAGRWRVGVRRLGQRAWLSEPLVLGAGVQPLALDLPDQPVVLPDLAPEASGRCRVRPALGVATTALLDAARTGLGVAEATVRLGLVPLRAEWRVRLLDPASLEALDEGTGREADRIEWPFATLPPDSVAADGFSGLAEDGSRVFYGPDSRLLATDWFLGSYCFGLVVPEAPGDTLVGLSFRPQESRRRTDVRGTLWMDRRDLGLRRLEFRWIGPGSWVHGENAGGELGFVPHPGGGVLLGRWWVRAPLVDHRPQLIGYLEAEGQVVEVPGAPPAP